MISYAVYQQSNSISFNLYRTKAARLVTRTKKNYHIPPVLRNLHWLPIKERIKLKLLLLTFKALHSQAPIYIIELLHLYTPTRSLRSSSRTTSFPCSFLSREKDPGWERKETGNEVANRNLLIVPKTCTTKTYRPFSIATPNLSLLNQIRLADSLSNFKLTLKAIIF